MSTVQQVFRDEVHHFNLRLLILRVLFAPMPLFVGSRTRTAGLRLAGFRIGRGTLMWGLPVLTGGAGLEQRLQIGQECWFNAGCRLDLSDTITIGDRVAFGHEVLIMTSSHDLGDPARRAGPLYTRPVTIGTGAWLGARAVILPGVSIGAGAVIAAGAVVNRDVPPNTLVGGVPARIIKELPC